MAKLEVAIKEAIGRGARREIRRAAQPLRRELRRLRHGLAQLRRDVAAIREVATRWQRAAPPDAWRPAVSAEDARAARLSPRLIGKLRARLGLSQAALGRLVGVSAAAVVQWERGRASPSEANRAALVGLRSLGRRDVKRLLAARQAAEPRRRRGRPRRGRAQGVRRTRRTRVARAPARRPRRRAASSG